jgi:hypothetical protein
MMKAITLALSLVCLTSVANSAELMFPQIRDSYYSGETIELAVSGVEKGEKATVSITPKDGTAGSVPVSFSVTGDGGADAFAVGKAENGVVTGDVIGPVDPNVRTGLRLCASAESEGLRPCRNNNCDPQGNHRVTSLGLSLDYGTRRVPTTFQ